MAGANFKTQPRGFCSPQWSGPTWQPPAAKMIAGGYSQMQIDRHAMLRRTLIGTEMIEYEKLTKQDWLLVVGASTALVAMLLSFGVYRLVGAN